MSEFIVRPDETVVAFRKVSEPWGWLGNMSPHPVEFGGKIWRTAEALFQAERFTTDNPVREAIRSAQSPMAAKMIAKKHRLERVIAERSAEDVALMRRVVGLKLEQNNTRDAQVRLGVAALLRTANLRIIEDCTSRPNTSGLFWGAEWHGGPVWFGQNTLGEIWMDVLAAFR